MVDISVVIHTHNEEGNIADCIKSAQLLTNDIIIIDSESTDNTRIIAQEKNAAVYPITYSNYVEPSRAFGIKKAAGKWIFIMDADERLTEALATEIKQKVAKTNKTHFKVPRKNIFGKSQWLQHGGWYPDFVIRLIKKDSFINWPVQIHSTPVIKGELGLLANPLTHYFHSDITRMVEKTALFEDIESRPLFDAKKNVDTATFFRKYFGELNRRLILKLGFLDGTMGIIESMYQAFSKTITYIFLYEKYKKSRSI